MKHKLPEEFLELCRSVTSKRPKTVIDHILEYGFITTEELKERYGYNHPPRAARDVREQGIPLETYSMIAGDGRRIAGYRFGDPTKVLSDKLSGRTVFSKQFKLDLIDKYGSSCAIHNDQLEERYLQIDHRVPYLVAGDEPSNARNLEDYMLLCSSSNRAKSWSCEHCRNGKELKDRNICVKCYWANPSNHTHVAMQDIRRLDIAWSGDEVADYDLLQKNAKKEKKDVPTYVKKILAQFNDTK